MTGCDVTSDVVSDGSYDHEYQLNVAAGTKKQINGGKGHDAGHKPVMRNDTGLTRDKDDEWERSE